MPPLFKTEYAPVAQLDRVPGYEPGGREFESLRARQNSNVNLSAISLEILGEKVISYIRSAMCCWYLLC